MKTLEINLQKSILILFAIFTLIFVAITVALSGFTFSMGGSGIAHSGAVYSLSFSIFDSFLILGFGAVFIGGLLQLLGKSEREKVSVSKVTIFLFIVILLFGIIFEIPNATQELKGIDEASHVMAAYFGSSLIKTAVTSQGNLGNTILSHHSMFPTGEFVASLVKYPPLTTFVSSLFFILFSPFLGINTAAATGAALLFGVLSAIAFYYLAKDFKIPEKVSLISAAVFFFLPGVYIIAGRPMFDTTLLFFSILTWLAFRRARRENNPKNWLVLGTVAGLGFLSKYTFVLIFVPLAVILAYNLFKKKEKLALKNYTVAILAFAALAVPWIYLALFKTPYLSRIWLNPEIHDSVLRFSISYLTSGMLATQVFGWVKQIGFAAILFIGALAIDFKARGKIERLEPLIVAIVYPAFFIISIGSITPRHIIFVIVPIMIYTLQVLGQKYGKRLLFILLLVMVGNIVVLDIGVSSGIVNLPTSLGYSFMTEESIPWNDVMAVVEQNSENNIGSTLPTAVSYYLIKNEMMEGRKVYSLTWGFEGYEETLGREVSDKNIDLLVIHKEDDQLNPPRYSFEEIAVFEGNTRIRVFRFIG